MTLLVSMPTLSQSLRNSINQNLNDIVELHDEILGELHRIIPQSESTRVLKKRYPDAQGNGHFRGNSLGTALEHSGQGVRLSQKSGMTAEPCVAAEVAQVFSKRV